MKRGDRKKVPAICPVMLLILFASCSPALPTAAPPTDAPSPQPTQMPESLAGQIGPFCDNVFAAEFSSDRTLPQPGTMIAKKILRLAGQQTDDGWLVGRLGVPALDVNSAEDVKSVVCVKVDFADPDDHRVTARLAHYPDGELFAEQKFNWYGEAGGSWASTGGAILYLSDDRFYPWILGTMNGHQVFVPDKHGVALWIGFMPDGKALYSLDNSGNLVRWDLSNGESVQVLDGAYNKAAISTDESFMVLGSASTLALVETASGMPKSVLKTPMQSRLSLSMDGRTLAVGLQDGGVILWKIREGQVVSQLDYHGVSRSRIIELSFSPDSSRLAVIYDQRPVDILDTSNGKLLQQVQGDFLLFSPDGSIVALADENTHEILLKDGIDGAVEGKIEDANVSWGPYDRTAVFSPDGRLFAAVDRKGEVIKVWSVPNGAMNRVLTGHTGRVSEIAISPDGKTLASIGNDNVIFLWNLLEDRQ